MSQRLEAFDQVLGQALRVEFIEVVGPEVLEGLAHLEDMVDDHQDGVGYRDGCAVPAPSRRDAAVLCGEVAALRTAGSQGDLDQDPAKPTVALGRLSAPAFAGAFVVAGAEASPR